MDMSIPGSTFKEIVHQKIYYYSIMIYLMLSLQSQMHFFARPSYFFFTDTDGNKKTGMVLNLNIVVQSLPF